MAQDGVDLAAMLSSWHDAPMQTAPRRSYDHRIRELVCQAENLDLLGPQREHHVPFVALRSQGIAEAVEDTRIVVHEERPLEIIGRGLENRT